MLHAVEGGVIVGRDFTDLVSRQSTPLGSQRLLDLYDKFGAFENILSARGDLGTGLFVVLVRKTGADPGRRFGGGILGTILIIALIVWLVRWA